ncbi:MAG: response regulator [Chloroflexi bacterium]|nr:MAG: response regulator [Chloroflexota bacterium]TMF63849.1 MAG: response regulator [Chloroflexota bacterium]TMG58760.1 MAG: response regulator [Chloroflexota bacterium]
MDAWHVPLQALHARADVPPSSRPSLRRVKRVLVAEDDADTAAAIKLTLEERLQITVDHVTNGALVLDQITATHPDLLILDVSMPGLNGIDVFDLLRGSAPSVDVPVLFLTATPDRAEQAFARFGISDVMAKPFDGDALARRVDVLLARAAKVA